MNVILHRQFSDLVLTKSVSLAKLLLVIILSLSRKCNHNFEDEKGKNLPVLSLLRVFCRTAEYGGGSRDNTQSRITWSRPMDPLWQGGEDDVHASCAG